MTAPSGYERDHLVAVLMRTFSFVLVRITAAAAAFDGGDNSSSKSVI